MSKELIINSTQTETRVAFLENKEVVEFFIERKKDADIVGNIYKGKVIKVLPGMQAAFVDFGLEKAGFLYVSNIDRIDFASENEDIFPEIFDENEESLPPKKETKRRSSVKRGVPIEDILKKNQEILVQVSKNPIGTKGARLTSFISLPGRHLVFMPTIDQIAISRRISSEAERKRLKKIISEVKKPGSGYIVRTVAEGHSRDSFIADSLFLTKLWNSIQKQSETLCAPELIYRDHDLVSRSLRDLDVNSVLIDSIEEYRKSLDFTEAYLPSQHHTIKLFKGREPIFESFGIEDQIRRSLEHKIWLKSGGFIVIEQTEALVSIDVNTGKYVGKKNQEETILKTNLEATDEIVRQLRLRNVGGIIIIDFIDMGIKGNREKVYQTLDKALVSDRSKTSILKVSELGIVEMSRKRVMGSLNKILCTECPYCRGKGEIISPTTISYEILREVQRLIRYMPKSKKDIHVLANPEVVQMLQNEEESYLAHVEKFYKKNIIINTDFSLHHENYQVSTAKAGLKAEEQSGYVF